jgi:hypothetical protein
LTANGFERREEPEPNRVPPLGLVGSAALFGAGALLLFLTTRVAVPELVSATGAETVVMWFLAASIVLFGPLLLTAALLLYRERRPGRLGSLGARLWFRAMNGGDWLWAVGGLAAAGVVTGSIGAALRMLQAEKGLYPSFMAFEPLGSGRYWILGAWLPFFVLNIVGEEFAWRGCRAAAARGCLRSGGLAGQWDPVVAVPRCLPLASPVDPCADHVDPALRGPASAQHMGRDSYPRWVRSDGLPSSSIRACLRVLIAPNPPLLSLIVRPLPHAPCHVRHRRHAYRDYEG